MGAVEKSTTFPVVVVHEVCHLVTRVHTHTHTRMHERAEHQRQVGSGTVATSTCGHRNRHQSLVHNVNRQTPMPVPTPGSPIWWCSTACGRRVHAIQSCVQRPVISVGDAARPIPSLEGLLRIGQDTTGNQFEPIWKQSNIISFQFCFTPFSRSCFIR